jgi:hypothetical protein
MISLRSSLFLFDQRCRHLHVDNPVWSEGLLKNQSRSCEQRVSLFHQKSATTSPVVVVRAANKDWRLIRVKECTGVLSTSDVDSGVGRFGSYLCLHW